MPIVVVTTWHVGIRVGQTLARVERSLLVGLFMGLARPAGRDKIIQNLAGRIRLGREVFKISRVR